MGCKNHANRKPPNLLIKSGYFVSSCLPTGNYFHLGGNYFYGRIYMLPGFRNNMPPQGCL